MYSVSGIQSSALSHLYDRQMSELPLAHRLLGPSCCIYLTDI